MAKIRNKKNFILLTGSRGFLGKNIVRRLSVKNKIFCISSKITNFNKNKNTVHFVYSKKYFNLNKLYKYKFTHIINCHGIIDHKSDYKKLYFNHYIFLEKLLKSINKSKLKKIIHIGSADEFEIENTSPIYEDNSMKGNRNNYAKAKFETRKLFKEYARTNNLNYIIFNIFNCYGYFQKPPRLISEIINSINKKTIFYVNNPHVKRDFLFIDDFLSLLEISLKNNKLDNDHYNIGYGKPTKIIDLLKYLSFNFNFTYRIGKTNKKNEDFYPSIKKISSKLNWSPKINIYSGITKLINND